MPLKMQAKQLIPQDFPYSSPSLLHCTARCNVPEAAVSQQPISTSNTPDVTEHKENSRGKPGCWHC